MVKKYWADAIKDIPESSKLAAEIYGEYVSLVSETTRVLEKVYDLLISLEDRAHGAAGEEMTELRRDVEKLLNKFQLENFQEPCPCCCGTGLVEGDFRDVFEPCLTCNGRGY